MPTTLHSSKKVRMTRPTNVFACLLAALLSTGCASSRAPAVITPEEIPALEARVARDASDLYAMLRLGAAYRSTGRLQEAGSLLECALALDPAHPATLLSLGTVSEDLGRYRAALRYYQQYMTVGESKEVKAQLEKRFSLLQHKGMVESVRESLAQEEELSKTTPEVHSVGVFPFEVRGGSEQFAALGRAMAEMVSTDLSQVDRVTVLERVRVQVLLDEIRLSEGGFVDETTAARSGRILGAGRIVQGWLGGSEELFQLSAAVVDVGPEQGRVDPLTEQGAMEGLFEMQKELVFSLFDRMAIDLTPAEIERINQRPTQSLQALLAYGRGLTAMDGGEFEAALRHFMEASRLDPDFGAARQTARSAEAAAEAETTSTEQLAEAGMEEAPQDGSVDEAGTMVPPPPTRQPQAEATGTDGLGRLPFLINLFFPRP